MSAEAADASIVFESDDSSLSNGLDEILARFVAVTASIQTTFQSATAAIGETASASNDAAGSLSQVSSAAAATSQRSGGISALAGALSLAAHAAQLVTIAIQGFAVTTQGAVTFAGRLVTGFANHVGQAALVIRLLPDSWGKWVGVLKQAAAEHERTIATLGVITKGITALQGRLGVAGAAFLAMQMHELGASKAMSAFGAAAALALSKTIAAARAATGAVAGLGRGIGSAAGGLFRQFSTGLSVLSPMAGLAITLGPIAATMLGVASAARAMQHSISEAAKIQDFTTSMATLLGSVEKAKQRMEDLTKFAASTPFELPEVVEASKVLQTLTQGALATGAGLRLIGDAAAVSGQPFQDLAVHAGRLYDGLMNGRAVGESLSRLQELGLLSAATRAKIEAAQKGGQKGQSVWALAQGDLERFSGEMDRRSNTWNGQMSNLKDGVNQLFQAFGAPVIEALTPFLKTFSEGVQKLLPWAQDFGKEIATWIMILGEAFSNGSLPGIIGTALKLGFTHGVNFLLGAITGVGEVLFGIMSGTITESVRLLSILTTADFWKGLGSAMLSAAKGFAALITDAVAWVMDALSKVPGLGKLKETGDALRERSNKLKDSATDDANHAGNLLAPALAEAQAAMERIFAGLGARFQKGFAEGRQVFDTKALEKELGQAWGDLREKVLKALDESSKRSPLPQNSTAPNADTVKAGPVSDLRKVGGGGFFAGGSDPVIEASRRNTTALQTNTLSLGQLGQQIGKGLKVVSVLG